MWNIILSFDIQSFLDERNISVNKCGVFFENETVILIKDIRRELQKELSVNYLEDKYFRELIKRMDILAKEIKLESPYFRKPSLKYGLLKRKVK